MYYFSMSFTYEVLILGAVEKCINYSFTFSGLIGKQRVCEKYCSKTHPIK
jgi:hypothetical protein